MPFGPRGNGAAGKVAKAKLTFNFEGDCDLPHIWLVLATATNHLWACSI